MIYLQDADSVPYYFKNLHKCITFNTILANPEMAGKFKLYEKSPSAICYCLPNGKYVTIAATKVSEYDINNAPIGSRIRENSCVNPTNIVVILTDSAPDVTDLSHIHWSMARYISFYNIELERYDPAEEINKIDVTNFIHHSISELMTISSRP